MNLIWSPIFPSLKEKIKLSDPLLLIICPFIQLKTLKKLVEDEIFDCNTKIITRWKANDIISQVSDINIYPYLKNRDINLYINNKIHLKLFVFRSNHAFHTSGNITNKGLGLIDDHNFEIGCFIKTNSFDWEQIFSLIDNSTIVTDEMFEIAKNYSNQNKSKKDSLPPLKFPSADKKDFSISFLPAYDNPESLYEIYCSPNFILLDNNNAIKGFHDITRFKIPLNLNQSDFFKILKRNFLQQSFVQKAIVFIRKQAPIKFGTFAAWLHNHCEDVPVPYRWEIKQSATILYNWLSFFVTEISWEIPGKRSQVLYWKD